VADRGVAGHGILIVRPSAPVPGDARLHLYSICGLSVAATMPLPGSAELPATPIGSDPGNLDPGDFDSACPDIVIRSGRVADFQSAPDYAGPTWQILGRRFLLTLPGLLRMRVEDGRDILVEPGPGVPEQDVVPFILSTGIGAILHQRGMLALHAATVAMDGKAIVLCGDSGAGKSTLAAALCAAGATLVADDIAAIDLSGSEAPLLRPDGRQHRLWAEAVERLGLAARRGDPIRAHIRKFHIQPASQAGGTGAFPLGAILLLGSRPVGSHPPGSPAAPPHIDRLAHVDAAPLLRDVVFRPLLASHMGRDAALFAQIAGLLARVPVFRLERSLGFDRLAETVAAVQAHVTTLR